jgi:hypothetical protein
MVGEANVAMSRSRAIVAVVLGVALALGLGSGVVLAPQADALASSSTLTVVDGAVFVRHGGSDFRLAREGDVIGAGDTLRTERGAAAEITYVEGSTVRIEANAEILIEGLRMPNSGVGPTLGRAWHVVANLIGGGSRYEMRTPSSTASVRG